MTGEEDRRENPGDGAHGPGGPGAHSGAESPAQERSVPGTASAEEGYQPGRGTGAGEPLEGVEVEEPARREPEEE